MARRATRFRHRCRASSKPRPSRSGCGSTISNNAAVVRSASRRETGASSMRSSSASRKPASGWRAASSFAGTASVGGDDGKRGGESRRSTWRSPMPTTARSASSATAGRMARLTSRPARSRFPRAKPRLSSVSGTPRPAATGCWPGPSCGHGCMTGRSTRRRSPPRPPRSATTSIPRRSPPP